MDLSKGNQHLVIVGAGSLGRMVASTLADSAGDGRHLERVAFLDDRYRTMPTVLGFPVKGGLDALPPSEDHAKVYVLAIADNRVRQRIALNHPYLRYASVIHPSAVVSRFAHIGQGVIILPNVSIDPDAVVGDHVVINKNVSVGHNAALKAFAQASPGCCLGGPIGEGAFLGLGSIVLPNVEVGPWSVIGAGAVVNRPIASDTLAMGIPCKPVKRLL
jgi:sugar O-acyltransferase (sialic acid O-acetyltransferase NeuD family)